MRFTRDDIERGRKAVEDEAIAFRDAGMFMVCGNGISVRWEDGSPSEIIRFRTDMALRIALEAMGHEVEDA